jgi:hypothetical protein
VSGCQPERGPGKLSDFEAAVAPTATGTRNAVRRDVAAGRGLAGSRAKSAGTYVAEQRGVSLDASRRLWALRNRPEGPGIRLLLSSRAPVESADPDGGYTESMIASIYSEPYRGLLVYDPWPPDLGVITKWENFATQTYQLYKLHPSISSRPVSLVFGCPLRRRSGMCVPHARHTCPPPACRY